MLKCLLLQLLSTGGFLDRYEALKEGYYAKFLERSSRNVVVVLCSAGHVYKKNPQQSNWKPCSYLLGHSLHILVCLNQFPLNAAGTTCCGPPQWMYTCMDMGDSLLVRLHEVFIIHAVVNSCSMTLQSAVSVLAQCGEAPGRLFRSAAPMIAGGYMGNTGCKICPVVSSPHVLRCP